MPVSGVNQFHPPGPLHIFLHGFTDRILHERMCSGLQPVETSVLFGDLVGAADVVVYPEVGLLQTHLENFTEVQ